MSKRILLSSMLKWWVFLVLGLAVAARDQSPLGEEMEIELSMFIRDEEEGKLYKERFNYASHDCGASIVKTNRQAKSANSILNENKDSYLLNPCNSNSQYVIIELCEDILIDEIEISNFEFYSSMFKTFKVSVSDRFPTTDWVKLGEFKAQNLRIQQRFQIENSIIWTKFIKFEVLDHYGDEYYCPISSIQVFGTTMIEQLKDEEKSNLVNSTESQIKLFDKTTSESLVSNQLELIDDSLYQGNVTFSNVNYEEDCIARPIIPMDKFLNEFNKGGNLEEQCLVSDLDETKPTKQPSQPAQPKDSIYKNINKRLEELERNSTISFLYQLEQSKIMGDAFLEFESLQLKKFQNLIGELNSTHVSHLNLMTMLSREMKMKNQLLSKEILKINENNYSDISREVSTLRMIILMLLVLNSSLIGLIIYKIGGISLMTPTPTHTTNPTTTATATGNEKSVDILGVEFKFNK